MAKSHPNSPLLKQTLPLTLCVVAFTWKYEEFKLWRTRHLIGALPKTQHYSPGKTIGNKHFPGRTLFPGAMQGYSDPNTECGNGHHIKATTALTIPMK